MCDLHDSHPIGPATVPLYQTMLLVSRCCGFVRALVLTRYAVNGEAYAPMLTAIAMKQPAGPCSRWAGQWVLLSGRASFRPRREARCPRLEVPSFGECVHVGIAFTVGRAAVRFHFRLRHSWMDPTAKRIRLIHSNNQTEKFAKPRSQASPMLLIW